tara:strand:+ start:2462 stop:2965 length:504 start_codon:yes stop_codon:yes gene_type:complete
MTGKEIIIHLINRGVILKVGEEYHPTSIVDELNANLLNISELEIDEPEKVEFSLLYPDAIREAGEKSRLKAVFDYCKVPEFIKKNGTNYMVRSLNNSTEVAFTDIMHDQKVSPKILLACIKDYYSIMEYPKSFKNFVGHGDLMALYSAYVKGDTLDSPEKPDSVTWG